VYTERVVKFRRFFDSKVRGYTYHTGYNNQGNWWCFCDVQCVSWYPFRTTDPSTHSLLHQLKESLEILVFISVS